MVNKAKKHSVSRRSMIGLSAAAVAAVGAYFYFGYLPGHTSTTSPPTTITTSTPVTTTSLSSSTSYSSSAISTTSTIPSTTTSTSSSSTISTTTTAQGDYMELAFESSLAKTQPSSDIFVVNGATGQDNGFETLIDLMGHNNLLFYNSGKEGSNQGQEGLIAKDDVLLIKVNSQWNERGGTNTDLIKAIIEAIKGHPDGFVGEIVVADNGQGGPGRGSLSDGGHLDYEKNNAEDISQSVQKVVDSSTGSYKISTYLWDNITLNKVEEYSQGDLEDGYVVQENVNEKTGIQVSYPKFKTKFGTYISFKNGLWDNQTKSYSSEKLKVINVPVLKTHSAYGVTGCTKHYMGVPSDRLTGGSGVTLGGTHLSIGKGGMGTLMAETRIPTLNILDAIWINARPGKGPQTYYDTATRVNVIMASKDPIALDYWASKHVLLQVAQARGYGLLYSVDPDFVPNRPNPSIFSTWINLSMEEIKMAGLQTTLKEEEMNVYVTNL